MANAFTPTTAVPQTSSVLERKNFYGNVASIRTWDNGNQIVGISLSYNEGIVVDFGSHSGNDASLNLLPGELISTLTLWPDTGNKVPAAIRITTSKNQTFQRGLDVSKAGPATICPVGSGIMTGLEVNYASPSGGLNRLGFIFYQPVRSMAVSNLVYINPPAAGSQEGVTLISLSQGSFTNNTADPVEYNFEDSVTKTTSTTYETSATQQWGVDVTVGGSFFDLVKVSTTVSWSMTKETRNSSTTELAIALQWSIKGTLPAKQANKSASVVNCTASCWQGEIKVDYSCDVTITFQDPTILPVTFPSGGTAKNVLYGYVTADSDDPGLSSRPTQSALEDTMPSKYMNGDGDGHHIIADAKHDHAQETKTAAADGTTRIPHKVWTSKHGIPLRQA